MKIPVQPMHKEYTYRFKCWAKSVGKRPENALVFDDEGIPHNLYEFSLWIQECWSEWRKLNGFRWDDPISNEDHLEFDVWLEHKVEPKTT